MTMVKGFEDVSENELLEMMGGLDLPGGVKVDPYIQAKGVTVNSDGSVTVTVVKTTVLGAEAGLTVTVPTPVVEGAKTVVKEVKKAVDKTIGPNTNSKTWNHAVPDRSGRDGS